MRHRMSITLTSRWQNGTLHDVVCLACDCLELSSHFNPSLCMLHIAIVAQSHTMIQ